MPSSQCVMVNATVQPEFEAEVENIKSEIEISGWENVFENELNEVGLIHPTGKGSSAKDIFPGTDRKSGNVRESGNSRSNSKNSQLNPDKDFSKDETVCETAMNAMPNHVTIAVVLAIITIGLLIATIAVTL